MLFKIYYITFYYFNDEHNDIRISALKLISELEKLWVRLFKANSEFYWQIFLDHNYLLKDKSETLRRVVFGMISQARFIYFGFDNLKFYLEVASILQSFFNLGNSVDKNIILSNFIQMVRSNNCHGHRIEKWPQIKREFLSHLRTLNIENNLLAAFFCASLLQDSNSELVSHVFSRIENVSMRFGVHLFSALGKKPILHGRGVTTQLTVKDESRVDAKLVRILDLNAELVAQLRLDGNLEVFHFWRTLKLSKPLEDLICVYLKYTRRFVGDESISQFKLKTEGLGMLMQVFLVLLLCHMVKLKKQTKQRRTRMSPKQVQKLEHFFGFLAANLKTHFDADINENLCEHFTLAGLEQKSNQIQILKGLVNSKKYQQINFDAFFGQKPKPGFDIFGKLGDFNQKEHDPREKKFPRKT